MPELPEQRSSATPEAEISQQLGAALTELPEPRRLLLLAAVLEEVGRRAQAAARKPAADVDGQAKKLQRLAEEKAELDDLLAAARADLAHRTATLEASQQRAAELERIVNDQRGRLQMAQQQVAELEGQLTAKTEQLYEAENKVEQLTVQLQRAQLKAGDTSRVDTLEESRRELNATIEGLRADLEQSRRDKDAVVERLQAELAAARASSGGGGETVLAALWERLARARPPLAPGGVKPPQAAAERLVDAFAELARFAHDFDQGVRPFLGSFIRHHGPLARPWDVYARSPGLHDVIREVIDAEHGKPAGVLKMRLLGLQRWTMAALMGTDASIESIAGELEQQLRSEVGMGSDPNRKVRDYLRDDGHHLFQQHIRELRAHKLAEAYTHGG